MNITLNGDPFTLAPGATITELLTRLDIDPRGVAVEQNFVVIRRDNYPTTVVKEGDQIEIVNFVWGG